MKTILVPTDFSPTADNAAHYALYLAMETGADIKLCNAFEIPEEILMTEYVSWSLQDYNLFRSETTDELMFLARSLEREEEISISQLSYHPSIDYASKPGGVIDVVDSLVNGQKLSLVIMGVDGAGGADHHFLGSNSRNMIDKAGIPVMLIPRSAEFKRIKKIAFATDLSMDDVKVVCSLADLARYFNADILITHIDDEKFETGDNKRSVACFLKAIGDKVDYDNLYYQHVKSIDVDHGIDWLTGHHLTDMLAMVHRPHNFLTRLLKGSRTKTIAKHITIPLLVFPPGFGGAI